MKAKTVLLAFSLMVTAGPALLFGADEKPVAARKVPALKGKRLAIAGQLARLSGLELATGRFFIAPRNWRNGIRPDVVSMQSPQPGTPVAAGARLACWVFVKAAENQQIIKMPDLKGMSPAAARKAIDQAGLKPMKIAIGKVQSGKKSTTEQPATQVVDQYPPAGRSVYVGTSVYFTSKVVK